MEVSDDAARREESDAEGHAADIEVETDGNQDSDAEMTKKAQEPEQAEEAEEEEEEEQGKEEHQDEEDKKEGAAEQQWAKGARFLTPHTSNDGAPLRKKRKLEGTTVPAVDAGGAVATGCTLATGRALAEEGLTCHGGGLVVVGGAPRRSQVARLG